MAWLQHITQEMKIKDKKTSTNPWPHSAYLDNRSTDSSIEPDPVKSWDHSIARNWTKDDRAEPLPLLREVIGMNLCEEHCQDHCKHGDQVYLTPVLERKEDSHLGLCKTTGSVYLTLMSKQDPHALLRNIPYKG